MREVTCGKCGKTFSADETGEAARCPHCNEAVSMTSTPGGPEAIQSAVPVDRPLPPGLEMIIPVKNTPAVIAYYLGIFSLAPCLGLVLCIPACILGIIGVVKATKHPEVKGKVHAWIGIVSPLFALGSIGLLMLAVSIWG